MLVDSKIKMIFPLIKNEITEKLRQCY